jgi:hypothetical protein
MIAYRVVQNGGNFNSTIRNCARVQRNKPIGADARILNREEERLLTNTTEVQTTA